LTRKKLAAERRKWQRLSLAIPLFVRCRDEKGKDLLEFATALNVSAGGMLVAVRRMLPLNTQYSLEIPSAPMADASLLPQSARMLQARPVRVVHSTDYHLLGLKFVEPLSA
jgi:c-di-GMP-binding flagellar brake protein YcgR